MLLKNDKKLNKGFTLIELMVSISVFSAIMVMSLGSIFTVLDANRKSQSVRSVMDNLSYTLEGMTRTIRFGSNYNCGAVGDVVTPTPHDCVSGADSIVLKRSDGAIVTYLFNKTNKSIEKNILHYPLGVDPEDGTYRLTSPDVTITNVSFRVFGSIENDQYQPQVIVVISGYAAKTGATKSSFTLETTLSQRKLDFN